MKAQLHYQSRSRSHSHHQYHQAKIAVQHQPKILPKHHLPPNYHSTKVHQNFYLHKQATHHHVNYVHYYSTHTHYLSTHYNYLITLHQPNHLHCRSTHMVLHYQAHQKINYYYKNHSNTPNSTQWYSTVKKWSHYTCWGTWH